MKKLYLNILLCPVHISFLKPIVDQLQTLNFNNCHFRSNLISLAHKCIPENRMSYFYRFMQDHLISIGVIS